MNRDKCYYKFMGLQNLRRFIEILLNERLYAARYDELNDPMEGAYLISPSNRDMINWLKTQKVNTHICSLSKRFDNALMWTHYADSHKGCCIEVSTLKKNELPTEINYTEHLPIAEFSMQGKDLLSHKSPIWAYEEEVRFFRKTKWLNIKIHRILFGVRTTQRDYDFYDRLIKSINLSIDVCQLSEGELDDGFIR